MNWKAYIYPLFHGHPRVVILDRAHMRYEEKDRFVPFQGEAFQGGFAFSLDSIAEWHSQRGTMQLSDDEKQQVVKRIAEELAPLGYKVTFD